MEQGEKGCIISLLIGLSILITIGGYFTIIFWSRQNLPDSVSIITGIVIALFLSGLFIKGTYPVQNNQIYVIIAMIIFVLWLFLSAGFFMIFSNNMPGYYDYKISITGLDGYSGGPITDIIVPLPVRSGADVFPDQDLQYKKFDNWTSLLVMTEHGKMLAFQTTQRNLTNINARFTQQFSEGIKIIDINKESLSPVLQDRGRKYTQWIYGDITAQKFTTQVYISNETLPKSPDAVPLIIDLELVINGGMVHSAVQNTYRVNIQEHVPQDARGWIPVAVQIGMLEKGNPGTENQWIPLKLE